MSRGWCSECGRASETDVWPECAPGPDVLSDGGSGRMRGLLGIALVLVLVGGILWWWRAGVDDPFPAALAPATQTSGPGQVRTCWDATAVSGDQTCPPMRGRDALF